ncbi:MAG: type II toxin-antitoxin system VapC family toxin [Rubrobacter sp.]|nr:type II toxin-antitoxin system VapC family toxin [Rubrobacter sp.]
MRKGGEALRFWDASAVAPLIMEEPTSEVMNTLLREDREIAVWWATWVECVSALSRRIREGDIGSSEGDKSRSKLTTLSGGWVEIQPTLELRSLSGHLLAAHPLRAADALQLAAALRWCGSGPEGSEFVSLDRRLRNAAEEEGFSILPVSAN